MQEYDESLEVGIAAGLDVPTAMALSERDDKPPRKGCGQTAAIVLIAAATVWGLLQLL